MASKKSSNVVTAIDLKDSYTDNKIENMRIDNKVNYSTITLNFYQDNTVQKLIVGNDRLEDYRPHFFSRLWLNLQNGWIIFTELILVITNLWMLVLLSVIGYFIYRHVRRTKTVRSTTVS